MLRQYLFVTRWPFLQMLAFVLLAHFSSARAEVPSPGFALTQGEIHAYDGVGFTLVEVQRLNNNLGEVSIDYRTEDDSAEEYTHYLPVRGRLTWADGDAEPKRVRIEFVQKNFVEANDTAFHFIISNPGGGTVGEPGRVIIHPGLNFGCAGRLDHSFGPSEIVRVPKYVNARVELSIRPNGKIVVGGRIRHEMGAVRLLEDGTEDPGFLPFIISEQPGESSQINAVAVQGNETVLLGGRFHQLNVPLLRLLANGAVDTLFRAEILWKAAAQARPMLLDIALSPKEDIFISGFFDEVNGSPRPGFARLNNDGSLDTEFQPILSERAVGESTTVVTLLLPYALDVLAVEEWFSDGGRKNQLIRFTQNGERDATFPPFGSMQITAVALQGDGRILVAHMPNYGDLRITRLFRDGAIDPTFNLPEDFEWNAVGSEGIISLAAQQDGKILVGGSFSGPNHNTPAFARFFSNGDLDPFFRPDIELNTWADDVESVTAIGLQSDGRIVIGGDFALVDSSHRTGLARLYAEGGQCNGAITMAAQELFTQEESAFVEVGVIRSGETNSTISVRYELLMDVSGYLPATAGIDFAVTDSILTFLPGETQKSIRVDLLNDETVETSEAFKVRLLDPTNGGVLENNTSTVVVIRDDDAVGLPGSVRNITPGQISEIRAITLDSEGRAIIGGTFSAMFGEPRGNIARLTATGGLDSFSPAGVNFSVRAVAVQPSGSILAGGEGGLVRLKPDGSVDDTFRPTFAGSTPYVNALLVLPDGKILVAGNFSHVNNQSKGGIARLNVDGSVDQTFDTQGGIQNVDRWDIEPLALALQPDGKVIIGGSFGQIGLKSGYHLARLLTDGTVDLNFQPNPSGAVAAISMNDDGSMIIGGDFDEIQKVRRSSIARLLADGTYDTGFMAHAQIDFRYYNVRTIVRQTDGKILVGGKFNWVATADSTYESLFRPGLARLNPNGVGDETFFTGLGAGGAEVYAAAVLRDGSILAGGNFTRFESYPVQSLVLLNGEGSNLPGRIDFAPRTLSGSENDGFISIRLRRLWGNAGTISARFQTYGNTAREGVDFIAKGGTITFGPGETEKELPIEVLNDNEIELWEHFTIELFDGPLAFRNKAEVVIIEDEQGIVFEQPRYEGTEGGQVIIRVYHLGPVAAPFSVKYRTRSLTAQEGSDFEAVSGVLNFSPDGGPSPITLLLKQDNNSDPAEEFELELFDPGAPVKFASPARILVRENTDPVFAAESLKLTTSGTFKASMAVEPYRTYRLLVSNDLVTWSLLRVFTPYSSSFDFEEMAAAGTQARFYRLEREP